MVTIGFQCSHELFPPDRLLRLARHAERAGFPAAMCSDHFNPWTERQGESGFAWSWLGAAMQATSLPFGVVNAPGQRYHPAIIAQASATLALMFPGRFWIALGTGQNLNEHITGDPWPPKDRRRARLRESVDLIRALWAGETVDHDGLVRVRDARLYTRPETPPMLYGAALSPETAGWVGSWADGLITVSGPRDAQRKLIDAFREGGGEGKPIAEQVALSWAESEAEALHAARRNWPVAAVDLGKNQDLPLPSDFDRETAHLSPDDMAGLIRVSSDLDRHAEWLRADLELGIDAIYLHPVGPDPDAFIDAFADRVLPGLG
jgi:probable non-F420 flavinoid oxidoreductase